MMVIEFFLFFFSGDVSMRCLLSVSKGCLKGVVAIVITRAQGRGKMMKQGGGDDLITWDPSPECRWGCLIWSRQDYTHSLTHARVLWIQSRRRLGPSTAAGHTGTCVQPAQSNVCFYVVRKLYCTISLVCASFFNHVRNTSQLVSTAEYQMVSVLSLQCTGVRVSLITRSHRNSGRGLWLCYDL